MADVTEFFVVAWFPPGGDRERAFTSEAKARAHAAKEGVGDWNPILFRRVRVTETTEEILPLGPRDNLNAEAAIQVSGEELEPKLDPYPYKVTNRATGKWVTSSREKWCFDHEVSTFKPDPGYSSDITDYQKED